MSDRELLEFAAKAAGIEFVSMDNWPHQDGCRFWREGDSCDCGAAWNPLTDDGDEARLEAVMGFNVEWRLQQVRVSSRQGGAIESYVDHGGDKQKARRRAGVRAAAAIGKDLP